MIDSREGLAWIAQQASLEVHVPQWRLDDEKLHQLALVEEAIIAAKGAGGMVRSMEEWAKHPQSAAIASLRASSCP